MKKLILLLPFLPFLQSCETEGDLTHDALKNTVIPQASASLKYTAAFVPTSGIAVNGTAEIYLENNTYKLS